MRILPIVVALLLFAIGQLHPFKLTDGANTTGDAYIFYQYDDATSIQGGINMGNVTLILGVGWIAFWVTAAWLFETKRHVFGFAAYIAGLFFLFTGLFAAIDDTSMTNPATANMLQMFVFPITWLLIASIVAFILYIFLGTLVKMAQTFGIRISNWWHEGRY